MNKAQYDQEDNWWRVEWSSVDAMITQATAGACTEFANTAILASWQKYHLSGRDSWVNCHTAESIKRSLVHCPEHLSEAVRRVKTAIEDDVAVPYTTRRKRVYRRDQGDELDADAFLRRDPEAWTDMERVPAPKRIIKLGVNIVASCGVKQEESIWKGATTLALSDLLNAAGFETEVTVFFAGQNVSKGMDKYLGKVDIKTADQPLNVDAATFVLCDIGFFRGVFLSLLHTTAVGVVNSNLGYPAQLPQRERPDFDFIVDFPIYSMDEAIWRVREQLEKLVKI